MSKVEEARSMRFSRYLALPSLVALCRTLRHSLGAGINIAQVFRQQGKRGPVELRPIARRIAEQLDQGNPLITALRRETLFPPLFLSLVEVGEESGHLAEVFTALEEYYTLQMQMQRRFRAGILLPAMQFSIAVVVIAVVIWILGVLRQSRGVGPGGILGLSGAGGAMIFVFVILGVFAILFVGGFVLRQRFYRRYVWDALILRLPGIGHCAQSLAMARFTLAMHLTLESGMLITRALRLSLQATGNAAFEAQAEPIVEELRNGENLTLAVTGVRIFPQEFRQILAVAEESGRLTEAMRQQCGYYQEEGERQVKALMQAATWAVWLIYAIFVVIMIFQLASVYFSALP